MASKLTAITIIAAAALALTGSAAAALSFAFGTAPSFSATLDGTDQTSTSTLPVTVSGANGAFSFTASATQFNNGSHTLAYPTVTAASTGACTGGACITATNTITGYPLSLASTVKIYSTADSKGAMPITFNLALPVAGNAFASGGTPYSSTLTLTIASTP